MHEDDPKAAEPRRRTTDSQKAARRVLSVLSDINKRPSTRDSRTIEAEKDARELVDEVSQVRLPLGTKTARQIELEGENQVLNLQVMGLSDEIARLHVERKALLDAHEVQANEVQSLRSKLATLAAGVTS